MTRSAGPLTAEDFVNKHGYTGVIGPRDMKRDLIRMLSLAKAEGIRMAAEIGVRTIIDGSDIEQSKFNLNEKLWALSNQIEKGI